MTDEPVAIIETEKPIVIPLDGILEMHDLDGKFIETEGIARGVQEFPTEYFVQGTSTAYLQSTRTKSLLALQISPPDFLKKTRLNRNVPKGFDPVDYNILGNALEAIMDTHKGFNLDDIAKFYMALSMLKTSSEAEIPLSVNGLIQGLKPYALNIHGLKLGDYQIQLPHAVIS